MNNVDKDNLIKKAICCSGNYAKKVADDFISGNICANKRFKKLAILISYIQALDCYKAPLEEIEYVYNDETSILTPTATTTEYTNCLIEDQADNIANQIALICDMCDEH